MAVKEFNNRDKNTRRQNKKFLLREVRNTFIRRKSYPSYNFIELWGTIMDLLNQFGDNPYLSAIEHACAIMGHPEKDKENRCYCRDKKFKKIKAKERMTLKMSWKREVQGIKC